MLPVMWIIDRYLLRQFVQTFLICFLSLVGLYVVFDLITHLDEFIECGRRAGGVAAFIFQYYCYQPILFFDRLGGLLALVSAMFTISWIQRHNEMTALMAAGVSRIRVLKPIIAAVAVVSLLAAVNRETLIPRYRSQLQRRPQDPAGDQPQALESRYDGRTMVLLGGKATFANKKRIKEPCFQMRSPLDTHGRQITADNAYYQPPAGDRPGGYLLDGVTKPKNLGARPSLLLKGEPVLITACDRPEWLKRNQCFLVSDVDFEHLVGGTNLQQMSSLGELIRGLKNPSLDYGASERVAIHARLVQPLLDLTLLFLGLPLVVTRESRNVFVAMGLAMVVTTLFSGVVLGAQFLGGISYGFFSTHSLAAWFPLMIFVPVAVWLAEGLWK